MTITEHADGVALELRGKGRCFLPGHPQSDSPVQADPPQQGYSRTTHWAASR